MTSGGGSSDLGVIFSYDPSFSTYKKLKDFVGTDGANASGSLFEASDGWLYGMTSEGGVNRKGVIFSYDPFSSTYTKLKDYDGANGRGFSYGAAFIELDDSIINNPPKVILTSPADSSFYNANATIVLNAAASDTDGTISKVEFYNDTTLLNTATGSPYTYQWANVPAGNYSLIAKATDNDGLATTSAPIYISVVSNQPPVVSITSPARDTNYVIQSPVVLSAEARDPDGIIQSVSFYNEDSLLFTKLNTPFTMLWDSVPTGTYHITAVAKDNKGGKTTSATRRITVVHNRPPVVNITGPADSANYVERATILISADAIAHGAKIKTVKFYNGTTSVSSRRSSGIIKEGVNDILAVKLLPNPVRNILNINTTGLLKNKLSTISVITTSGVILQTKQLNNLTPTIQVDVSSFASGVYIIKMISGDKVIYKQFVKL